MSQPKTKIVEIGGARYQFRKLSPEAGSYIAMKLVGAANSSSSGQEQAENVPQGQPPAGEDLVRAVAFGAFLNGLDFETHCFVQRQCLACVSRLEDETPMPIMNGAGIIPDVRDDMSLVMRLEIEALVFSIAPFFEQGGLRAMAGPPKE